MTYVFEPPARPVAPVLGGGEFPIRRIFCIGRNYVDHVKEMGGDPKADPPVFFTKPADAIVPTGSVIPYPSCTENFHYEGELVIALKRGGRDLRSDEEAAALIFGQAAGCDLTRRDLQTAAKVSRGPWDSSKGFDRSAPVGLIARIEDFPLDLFGDARLTLSVNGELRQSAELKAMIWSVPEILKALSRLFELRAGDLVFTGTPDGVGALERGDRVEVTVGPLPPLEFWIEEGADGR